MSRLSSMSDSTGMLAGFKYLGLGQIVEEDAAADTLSCLDSTWDGKGDATNIGGSDKKR